MEQNETIDSMASARAVAQIDHPEAGSINTMGILGLVFTFVFGLVGLILNIINLSKSGRVLQEIKLNQGMYTEDSIKKIKSGRTCSIVGLSIQGALILLVIILFGLVAALS